LLQFYQKEMTHQLENKRIVVAGGTSGIGRALVDLLTDKKAIVTAIGRDPQKLSALRTMHPAVRAVALDARDRDGVAAFFEQEGDIDHLVLALSGSKGGGEFKTLELDGLREGFDQKFWPQLAVIQAALSHLRLGGSVTFITAISATAKLPGSSGLAAINGALEIMVPILSKELKPLRVNAVSPGVIDTPWWDFLPADVKQGIFADISGQVSVGRIGRAQEVADAVRFVLENEYINGTVIGCHGGI
jgi:NAD(P)-dependent dehydrogenase (short-subunit alcohol dehydrogenase family)